MILPLRICNWWRAPSLIESRSKQWCDILILMCVAVMTILMYYLISCRLPEAAIEMMLVLLLSSSYAAAAVDDVCSLPLLGTITRCVFFPTWHVCYWRAASSLLTAMHKHKLHLPLQLDWYCVRAHSDCATLNTAVFGGDRHYIIKNNEAEGKYAQYWTARLPSTRSEDDANKKITLWQYLTINWQVESLYI
jgi:hypothetical protein